MPIDTSASAIAQLYRDYGSADFAGNWVAQDWNLHDMVGYGANQNKYQFFTVPAGQNDPVLAVTKKREQSNLKTQNQIGGDYLYIVERIRLFVLNSAKARQLGTGISAYAYFSAQQLQYARLHQAICARGTLRWSLNEKTMLLENQPFQTFAAGIGLGVVCPPNVGFTDGDPAAINNGTNAYSSNSEMDIDGGRLGDPFSLAQPVVLAPSTTINVDLEYPLGVAPSPASIYGASINQTATIWLCCWLDGQMVRPRS